MKIGDVAEILVNAHVDPTYYSLFSTSDGLCILPEGQCWKVFISERDTRHEEEDFATEDAACVYFLKRIFELWRPR